jgi:hypothetical protein
MVRAMASAGPPDAPDQGPRRLLIAGPPAEALTNVDVLRGKRGGLLAVVDASTGRRLSQTPLAAPPTWDGLCVVRGRTVVSLTSGAVVCFE